MSELTQFLKAVSPFVVIIGSVARREPHPKDLDLLLRDTDRAHALVRDILNDYEFTSVFPGQWTVW